MFMFSAFFFFFFEDVCIQLTPFQGLVRHASTLGIAQPLRSTMFHTNYLLLI